MRKIFSQTLRQADNKDQSLKKIISRVAILATSSMVIMGSTNAMADDVLNTIQTVNLSNNNGWRRSGGAVQAPKNGDNIILDLQHNILNVDRQMDFESIKIHGNNSGIINLHDTIVISDIGEEHARLSNIHFCKDSTLRLNKGSVYLKNGISTRRDGQGMIFINGNTKVVSKIGSKDRAIKHISFSNDNILEVHSDIYTKKIKSRNSGQGIIRLERNAKIIGNIGSKSMEQDGTITINSIKRIGFTKNTALSLNGDIYLTEGIKTKNNKQGVLLLDGNTSINCNIGVDNKKLRFIKFLNDYTLTLKEKPHLTEGIITNRENTGSLVFTEDIGSIDNYLIQGKNNLKLLELRSGNTELKSNVKTSEIKILNENQKLIIENNVDFSGKITGSGNVIFKGNITAQEIGSNNEKLKRIFVQDNVSFYRAIYAKTLDIKDNGFAAIRDRLSNFDRIRLEGQNSKILFENGLANPVKIIPASDGNGNVEFQGNGEVGAIGSTEKKVHSVVFRNQAGESQTLHGNIYAETITFSNGDILADNENITINGVVGDDNVPEGWVKDGNALRSGKLDGFAGSITRYTDNDTNYLHIENTPIDIDKIPTPEQEIEELLFLRESTDSGNPDNLDDSSNRTSQSVNQRQEYSKDTLRIVDAMDNASDFSSLEGVADMFDEEKTLSFQNAHKVEIEASLDDESIEEASVADKKKLYLSTIVSTDKETQKKESAKRDLLVKSSPKVSKAFISQAFATTRKRQNNINMGIAAIAAGDDGFNIAKGLWVSGLYGVSNQDSVKDASGYKGKIAGGSVGGDIDINDDTMIGVSYSRLLSGVKFKDNLSGNKLDINSNIVSLYGRQNITDKFYINGMVSFGKSQINNKRSLEVAGLSKTAKSKTNNTSYNAELDVSYNLTGKQMIVIPSVGLRYSYYTNGSYKESGAGVHNLEFDKSSYSDGAFVAGTKMLMPKRLSGDTKIAPSISLSVEKEIRTKKQPTVRTKLSWMDKYIESEPSLKGTTDASGNIGLGMLIEHKNLEMNAQYNLHFKERYKAHQGSLQLKINF